VQRAGVVHGVHKQDGGIVGGGHGSDGSLQRLERTFYP
jgi:hypothetical protein